MAKSIEIENKLGELYTEFTKRFTKDPEIEKLFARLAEEEHGHARALEFVGRVMRGFKGKMEVNPLFEPLADALLRDLTRALDMMREGKAISAQTALSISVKIENSLIEEQRTELFETDSPELIKTFKMLNIQTEGHKQRLEAFIESRKT